MPIYDKFAQLYTLGPYTRYSQRMAELLPAVLRALGIEPRKILDLACGEGTFVVAAAKQGWDVTGLDASGEMLQAARRRLAAEGLDARLLQGDMRELAFTDEFDLVTCWYDSLNYLVEQADLEAAFRGVAAALRRGGRFIFDMNTIFGLAALWASDPCQVMQDTPGLFDVHINSYDYEANLATKRIAGFVSQGGSWVRIDEEHRERGYRLEEIAASLKASGLEEIARWGRLEDMSPPDRRTGRVWFAAKKAAA
ncbi:MAG TPA: methyltransferase domain-containing protein [bacterium]|nr:methyltransferase domain-containing protein [bacterium]